MLNFRAAFDPGWGEGEEAGDTGRGGNLIIAKCICAKNYGCFDVNHNQDKIVNRKGINCFRKITLDGYPSMYV